jgi:hypothetical protein
MIELLIGATLGVLGTIYTTNKDVRDKVNTTVKDGAKVAKEKTVEAGKWVKSKMTKKSEDK